MQSYIDTESWGCWRQIGGVSMISRESLHYRLYDLPIIFIVTLPSNTDNPQVIVVSTKV